MFGSFRFFHAITPNVGWTFFSLCFLFPSLLVYGSICPQRGKNQGKSDKIFFWAFVLCGEVDKMALLRVFLSHVRAYARAFQQRCWFFAVTSVTQGEILREKLISFWKAEEREKRLLVEFSAYFQSLKIAFVKICLIYIVIDWIIVCCLLFCDTCDSKNAKTPVMCVYACAREKGVIDVFTIRMQCSRFLFRG